MFKCESKSFSNEPPRLPCSPPFKCFPSPGPSNEKQMTDWDLLADAQSSQLVPHPGGCSLPRGHCSSGTLVGTPSERHHRLGPRETHASSCLGYSVAPGNPALPSPTHSPFLNWRTRSFRQPCPLRESGQGWAFPRRVCRRTHNTWGTEAACTSWGSTTLQRRSQCAKPLAWRKGSP